MVPLSERCVLAAQFSSRWLLAEIIVPSLRRCLVLLVLSTLQSEHACRCCVPCQVELARGCVAYQTHHAPPAGPSVGVTCGWLAYRHHRRCERTRINCGRAGPPGLNCASAVSDRIRKRC